MRTEAGTAGRVTGFVGTVKEARGLAGAEVSGAGAAGAGISLAAGAGVVTGFGAVEGKGVRSFVVGAAKGEPVTGGIGVTVCVYTGMGVAPLNVPGPATVAGAITPPAVPPMHGVGKSSHVSQCVQPVEPAARATATTTKLYLNIPVSFPKRGWPPLPLVGSGLMSPGVVLGSSRSHWEEVSPRSEWTGLHACETRS